MEDSFQKPLLLLLEIKNRMRLDLWLQRHAKPPIASVITISNVQEAKCRTIRAYHTEQPRGQWGMTAPFLNLNDTLNLVSIARMLHVIVPKKMKTHKWVWKRTQSLHHHRAKLDHPVVPEVFHHVLDETWRSHVDQARRTQCGMNCLLSSRRVMRTVAMERWEHTEINIK